MAPAPAVGTARSPPMHSLVAWQAGDGEGDSGGAGAALLLAAAHLERDTLHLHHKERHVARLTKGSAFTAVCAQRPRSSFTAWYCCCRAGWEAACRKCSKTRGRGPLIAARAKDMPMAKLSSAQQSAAAGCQGHTPLLASPPQATTCRAGCARMPAQAPRPAGDGEHFHRSEKQVKLKRHSGKNQVAC